MLSTKGKHVAIPFRSFSREAQGNGMPSFSRFFCWQMGFSVMFWIYGQHSRGLFLTCPLPWICGVPWWRACEGWTSLLRSLLLPTTFRDEPCKAQQPEGHLPQFLVKLPQFRSKDWAASCWVVFGVSMVHPAGNDHQRCQLWGRLQDLAASSESTLLTSFQ